MVNKRGDYKYSIILSLILGLMILSLSLLFIFNEYFSEEDIDYELCRQSVLLRSTLPEDTIADFVNYVSFKDDYPLKCRTMVKEIDESDIKSGKAEKIIAETMAECWALYDKGDSSAFPSKFLGAKTVCVPCARIHLTEGAKDYMSGDEGDLIKINIREALDLRMTEDYSYYSYLRDSGKDSSALSGRNNQLFNLEGDSFIVDDSDTGISIIELFLGSDTKISKISFPEYFYYDKGDLLVNYGIMTFSGGEYKPYLFYFQTNQDESPFEQVKNIFVRNQPLSVKFCNAWEGIPA
jgi:hypothetical protein